MAITYKYNTISTGDVAFPTISPIVVEVSICTKNNN